MKKERARYLYYSSIVRKERLIEGLKELNDKQYRLELLKLYTAHFGFDDLFSLSINDIDELLLELSKKEKYFLTYRKKDYLYLKNQNKKELLISMFYTRTLEDAKEMILMTGVYNDEILWCLRNSYGLNPLIELFKLKKDNSILVIAYGHDDAIELYKKFLPYIDDEWTNKFINKIIKECKIGKILEEQEIFSTENLIKIWHLLYNTLTSENVYTIFSTNNYEKKDIPNLISILIREKNPYYLYLVLINNINLELDEQQKTELENALRQTKNIEYNLYYDFYKNKSKLIKKFGNIINLLVYICVNKDLFANTYEYIVIKEKLETDVQKEAIKSINTEEIHSFLFRDSEAIDDVKENTENTKKMVKNVKKNKK